MEVEDDAWQGPEDGGTHQQAAPPTPCKGSDDPGAAFCESPPWGASPLGSPELMPRWLQAALLHLNGGP